MHLSRLCPSHKLTVFAGLCVAVSLAAFSATAQAAAADFDLSFGTAGKVIDGLGTNRDQTSASAIQPDGKIIIAGLSNNGSNNDFSVARYNADGTPDTTFGTAGKVTTDFTGLEDTIKAVVVRPNGKIVVAGTTVSGADRNFAIARYNSNGTLDTTLGGAGKVSMAIGTGNDFGFAMQVQSDEKIVVAGSADSGSTTSEFALTRLNVNGTPDSTFGTAGKLTTNFGGNRASIYALKILPDGKFLAAGYTEDSSGDDFALARYNPDGTLDSRSYLNHSPAGTRMVILGIAFYQITSFFGAHM